MFHIVHVHFPVVIIISRFSDVIAITIVRI